MLEYKSDDRLGATTDANLPIASPNLATSKLDHDLAQAQSLQCSRDRAFLAMTDPTGDAHVAPDPSHAQPDDSILKLLPRSNVSSPTKRAATAAGMESSYVEAATVDDTGRLEDTISEEAVREHLRDVELSFLPALSPISSRSTLPKGSKADESQDSSEQPQAWNTRRDDKLETTELGNNTSSLEVLDSSPTAAAAARTISRAVSMASNPAGRDHPASAVDEFDSKSSNGDSLLLATYDPFLQSSQAALARSDSSKNPGNSLRAIKRPKYLRSRHGSQRSSVSSFISNPESQEGSEATVGLGVDYALQSGGALPTMGAQRSTSDPFQRSTSMGSVVSRFGPEDSNETSSHQLDTLPEASSPSRQVHNDPLKTPKASRGNLKDSAPTDTIIAQHVKNVQVPESLVKEYKFKNGLQTPRLPTSFTTPGLGTVTRSGKNFTLKEQSNTIERLSKENFDLKLKVMFLSDRLDKLSEEGIKEMISENVELKTSLAVLQRDNKVLRKRVKELERQAKGEERRPGTASSTDRTTRVSDEEAYDREQELIYLRERVEEYASEIEKLRSESLSKESEKRQFADIIKTMSERTGDNLGQQEESDVWKDLLEQETARREQADDDNRKLRDEIFRLKKELSVPGNMHHTTNIYNISKKGRDGAFTPSRPLSGLSGEVESSHANFSAASTLVDDLRRESEQLRHENAELRREVGAQTSMLTSRNREKERLYQEIEDLKMAQRRGGAATSTVDSIFERSASRAGAHERSRSRGSGRTGRTLAEEEAEREELENKLAELRDKTSEVKLQNQELQRELESCMEDFENAVEGRRQAEENALSLQAELENTLNDLVVLQAERDEAIREQGEMEHEFEALRREAQDEIDALEAEADARNEEMQRTRTDLRDRSENFDALQQEMRKMSDILVRLEDEQDAKLRRIKQVEEELDASNKELEELEQKLMEANEKNQRYAIQQESSQGEIAFLREEQEADKIRIGDLEAAVASAELTIRDEKERVCELENRVQQERMQREIVADKEKEEVQQVVNELNREASNAKDEVRRLRKSLSSREVEATEWKERLIELENNLREALGDLNGTRSSLLKVCVRAWYFLLLFRLSCLLWPSKPGFPSPAR